MLKKGSLIWPVNEPEAEIILIGGGHFKHSLLTLGETPFPIFSRCGAGNR